MAEESSATESSGRVPIGAIVQLMLSEGRRMDLTPWDIALLVMVQREIEESDGSLISIPHTLMQSLGSRLDLIEAKAESHAERRLTESVTRLMSADCLAKANTGRLRFAGGQEYLVTHLGEEIAKWHTDNVLFSGDPLTAVYRAFIAQLSDIAQKAEESGTAEYWKSNVTLPLQYVANELLISIQRHQKELDRRHDALKQFIPTLLTQAGDAAIDQCEAKLKEVIRTINDLQEAILVSMSSTTAILGRIEALSGPHAGKDFDTVADDLARRLHAITQWTQQRVIDWFDYHYVVHGFLRTVIRVDRSRRLTAALKRAIATPPTWTIEVADSPFFLRMRDDIVRPTVKRSIPRVAKTSQIRKRHFDQIPRDDIPDFMETCVAESLAATSEATATAVMKRIAASKDNSPDALDKLTYYLPTLMDVMLTKGLLDDRSRDWTPVAASLEMQELRVTARERKDEKK